MRANHPALVPLALTCLLALAAPAAAQDAKPEPAPACPDGQVETPEGCSQQAWVDCPPDMMCAAGGNATCDADDTSCAAPMPYGPDGCIECSGPAPDTCMDGAQGNETCRDDVQYIGGPAPTDTDGAVRGPADGSCEECRGEDADSSGASVRDASMLGLAGTIALLGAAVVAFAARRQM